MKKNKCVPELVSVIINVYNGAHYLMESIPSVLAQSYKKFEIIVFDNKSTDEIGAVLDNFKDDRIKHYRTEEHFSLGKARNIAIEKASGEYIAFLDADDIWTADKLQTQIECMLENFCEFCYSNYYLMKGSSCTLAFKSEQPSGMIFDSLLKNYFVCLSTVVFKSSVLDRLDKNFNESYSQIEEYDLFLRMLYLNNAAYVNKPLTYYRIHNSMFTKRFPLKGFEEIEDFCVNFPKNFKGINDKYPIALNYVDKNIRKYSMAKYNILYGNKKYGRKLLISNKIFDKKSIVYILISLVPKGLAKKFMKDFPRFD